MTQSYPQQRPDRRLQYGRPHSTLELVGKVIRNLKAAADAAPGEQVDRGVEVEFVTTDPRTSVSGVVTAVGGKFGATLLTVEPLNQPTETERALALAAAIRRVDGRHDLGAAALAEALLREGVIPTRNVVAPVHLHSDEPEVIHSSDDECPGNAGNSHELPLSGDSRSCVRCGAEGLA